MLIIEIELTLLQGVSQLFINQTNMYGLKWLFFVIKESLCQNIMLVRTDFKTPLVIFKMIRHKTLMLY